MSGEVGFEVKMEGLEKVMRKMKTAFSQILFITKDGMIAGALLLQRESQKITPVDTGNLKASAFTLWVGATISVPNFKDAGIRSKRTPQEMAKLNSVFTQAVTEATQVVNSVDRNTVIRVLVGYGAFYAIYVHERVTARHTPPGQSKFLEQAANIHMQAIVKEVRMRSRKVLR